MTEFKLPDIGEGIKEVIITDILIKKNQVVKINDLIMIVESEKSSMEIPSDFNGKIKEIHVKKGQTINPGNLILTLSTNDNQSPTTEEDKNKVVCRNVKVSGTRLPRRVCRTIAEEEALAERSQRILREERRRATQQIDNEG